MKIEINNKIEIFNASAHFTHAVCERLTFTNPQWLENDKRGFSNWQTPRLLRFYEETGNGLIIPRGFTGQLIAMARSAGIKFQIDDQRRILPEVGFSFTGTLRPFQEEATIIMRKKDFGTLSAPTGSGKTVMALYMIAERKQPALIVVHTKELLNQWINRAETFLGIPSDDIGVIGSGKHTIGKVTVALVQSLFKCAAEVAPYIGHLIIDECHRAPSRTFTEAVTAFDSRYMLGLSATPWRRDKLSRLIFWFIGDVVHLIDSADLIESGDILRAEVITRETDFQTSYDPSAQYSKMLSELTEDRERNIFIALDVVHEAKNGGGICLVLSDRKNHCETLQEILNNDFNISAELLTGDIADGKRKDVVKRLNEGDIRVLIATGQLIGEGFDLPEMQTLFLTTPIKFTGRVLQYLGRVLRSAPGKDKATVYDYVDSRIGVLGAAAKSRAKVYEKN